MSTKKAAKLKGRPREAHAKPESLTRRERYQRMKRGESAPPGRPKSDEIWHPVRLTLSQAMFNRVEAWEKTQGLPLLKVQVIRHLIDLGLKSEGQ